jgi:hypothetical protein
MNATFALSGSWGLEYANQECLIVFPTSGSQLRLYKFNHTSINFDQDSILSSTLTGINANSANVWRTSDHCERFSVDNYLFGKKAGGSWQQLSNPSSLPWAAIDDNLTYAVANNGSLYRLDLATNTFFLFFMPTRPFSVNSVVYVWEDRVIVAYTNSTGADVYAFLDSTGTAKSLFNYSSNSFSFTPRIYVSPNLTKIVVVGQLSTLTQKVDAFSINYATLSSRRIVMPSEPLLNGAGFDVAVGDSFLAFRQKSIMGVNNRLREFGYFLAGDVYPKQIYVKYLIANPNAAFQKVLMVETGRGQAYYLS